MLIMVLVIVVVVFITTAMLTRKDEDVKQPEVTSDLYKQMQAEVIAHCKSKRFLNQVEWELQEQGFYLCLNREEAAYLRSQGFKVEKRPSGIYHVYL